MMCWQIVQEYVYFQAVYKYQNIQAVSVYLQIETAFFAFTHAIEGKKAIFS